MTRAFRTNLTALSLLALVVGAFLIYATLSFLTVRRRPVAGMALALGLTPGQLFRAMLAEAMTLGAAGTALGLVLGHLLGAGLTGLVLQSIEDLYFAGATAVRPEAWIYAKGAALGLAATALAGIAPALAAARTSPRALVSRAHARGDDPTSRAAPGRSRRSRRDRGRRPAGARNAKPDDRLRRALLLRGRRRARDSRPYGVVAAHPAGAGPLDGRAAGPARRARRPRVAEPDGSRRHGAFDRDRNRDRHRRHDRELSRQRLALAGRHAAVGFLPAARAGRRAAGCNAPRSRGRRDVARDAGGRGPESFPHALDSDADGRAATAGRRARPEWLGSRDRRGRSRRGAGRIPERAGRRDIGAARASPRHRRR